MHTGRLVQADLLYSASKGRLTCALIHRCASGSALKAIRTTAGKEPDRIAMGQPVGAQQGQGPLWQWDGAVLVAFAAPNVQLHAGTIDLGHLELHVKAVAVHRCR